MKTQQKSSAIIYQMKRDYNVKMRQKEGMIQSREKCAKVFEDKEKKRTNENGKLHKNLAAKKA